MLGDFAFAIWDTKRDKLFCARDHLGVKPFYYYIDEKMFTFASDINSLKCVPEISIQINELKIAQSLAQLYSDQGSKFYQNLFRLPAASQLTVNFDKFKLKQYWELDPDYEIKLNSDEEYVERFLQIFSESIKCRLRTEFKVGSMMSGGLDSSSISVIAQKILKQEYNSNLHIFSAIFDTVPDSNERSLIEKVISNDDYISHFIEADQLSPLFDIEKLLSYTNDPAIPPNSFMLFKIYQEAEKSDIKVILDGLEGDITLSHGKGYIPDLLRKSCIKSIKEIYLRSIKMGTSPLMDLINFGILTFTPLFIKRTIFLNKEKNQRNGSHTRILNKNFMYEGGFFHNIIEYYLKLDSSKKIHYANLTSGFIQFELELVDKMSAHYGLEIRHPFFDKRLVEFCLALPIEQKIFRGWDRFILRKAMNGILPEEVQWKKIKTSLSHNFQISFLDKEKERLDDLFSNPKIIEDYIDVSKLYNIYHEYRKGNTNDLIYLWESLILYI